MHNYLKFKIKDKYVLCVLLVILTIASFFRLYSLNWDQNQHLHPDERFLTMVTEATKWPSSISEYLNPQISPLNPYNANYDFFVYGTLPFKIVKLASDHIIFDQYPYNNITLVGRLVSAIFDIGTVFFVFKIGEKIFDEKVGLLSSFLYAISVLPIQLSHFYAVDTFLVFFLTLSFFLLLKVVECHPERARRVEGPLTFSILLGISFGLALACKISALYFLPIIGFGFLYYLIKTKNLKLIALATCYMPLAAYLTFRLTDPRVFASANIFDPHLNPLFIENLKQLKSFDNPEGLFPPAVQWLKTKPIIFPLKNMLFWGLGLPLGILSLAGVTYSVKNIFQKVISIIKHPKQNNELTNLPRINALATQTRSIWEQVSSVRGQQINEFLILSWILLLFFYQGTQFVKALRYLYPIYPFLTILAANISLKILKKINHSLLHTTYYLLLFLWPLSFIYIYSRPHSRVTASEWIYQNIPQGSTLSCEHWDDCLPLTLGNKSYQLYKIETLELYNPDSQQKWSKINSQLNNIDYLILSSNRLWGSIPKVPEKYPVTSEFYEYLLAEKLGFTKVVEITSYPTIPIINIPIPDDSADESFTVYDHPKVLIYKRI